MEKMFNCTTPFHLNQCHRGENRKKKRKGRVIFAVRNREEFSFKLDEEMEYIFIELEVIKGNRVQRQNNYSALMFREIVIPAKLCNY